MGIFDKLFKKGELKEEPKAEPMTAPEQAKAPEPQAEEAEAVGWDAIEKEFLRVYPGQTNPKHYGTIIKWIMG